MSCHTDSFARCKYESPSFEIYDMAVDTALLVASVGTSSINPYADDLNAIDL